MKSAIGGFLFPGRLDHTFGMPLLPPHFSGASTYLIFFSACRFSYQLHREILGISARASVALR